MIYDWLHAIATIEGWTDQRCKRELFGNRLRAAPNSNGVALAKSGILENFCKRTSTFIFCVEVRNTQVIQQVSLTH